VRLDVVNRSIMFTVLPTPAAEQANLAAFGKRHTRSITGFQQFLEGLNLSPGSPG
jgi:hypothetical protein